MCLIGHAGGIAASIESAAPAMRGKLQRRRARLERGDEMPVLDVVAEGIEPDFGGGKQDLRRANEPPGVVDEADFAQRRGVRHAGRPYAERFQRRDRTGKQRRGAVIGLGRRRDQQRVDAGRGQRDGATRPAGPPPMTATSALNVSLMPSACDLRSKV